MNENIINELEKNEIQFTITSDNYLILHDYNDMIIDFLDNNRVDYYYDDSCTSCSNCNCFINLYNYHFSEAEVLNDCEIVCNDCIKKDYKQEYLYERVNKPKKAIRQYIISHDDMVQYGYDKLDKDYNTGLYEWSNDNPQDIYDSLKNDYSYIVFMITDSNPFNVEYVVYVKK
jgi:hypothetical protein